MNHFLEYFLSVLIWMVVLFITSLLLKRASFRFVSKLKFIDLVLVGLLVNVVFFLLEIKAINLFTSRFNQINYENNPPWGHAIIKTFFDKVKNWFFILFAVLILIFRRRNYSKENTHEQ